jgi:hypothetical protein
VLVVRLENVIILLVCVFANELVSSVWVRGNATAAANPGSVSCVRAVDDVLYVAAKAHVITAMVQAVECVGIPVIAIDVMVLVSVFIVTAQVSAQIAVV